ncbi:hypothetical protein [Salinicoccus sp. HZC-1]|uniref:hypothetical protein n=1 Tax=Salinicoccus sp. HZC-1 TaxID=3385497 RepID=UPI00398B6B44
MNFSNIFFRLLTIIISFVSFAFYVYIIANFTNGNVLEFPYLLLTVYFSVCTISYPFIALKENKLVEKFKFLPSSFSQLAIFTASPFMLFRTRRKKNLNEK